MQSILEELWYGNICPNEGCRKTTPEVKELMGYIADHHEALLGMLTDKQKETFEKFHNCWSEYISLSEAAIFEYAFKLGANLMLNTVKD